MDILIVLTISVSALLVIFIFMWCYKKINIVKDREGEIMTRLQPINLTRNNVRTDSIILQSEGNRGITQDLSSPPPYSEVVRDICNRSGDHLYINHHQSIT